MLAERVYKLIIHTTTTAANFFILKNSAFLHRNLLGDNDEVFFFKNYPCQVLPNYLDDLYIIKLSYHFYEQFYTLAFQRQRRDFAEISLHHFLTIILVLFSYNTNYIPFGAAVMLVHDVTDTAVSIFKITVDITHTWFQAFTYFIMFISWIYLRLYIFPVHIMTKLISEITPESHIV